MIGLHRSATVTPPTISSMKTVPQLITLFISCLTLSSHASILMVTPGTKPDREVGATKFRNGTSVFGDAASTIDLGEFAYNVTGTPIDFDPPLARQDSNIQLSSGGLSVT